MNCLQPRVIIYDCEIEKAIPPESDDERIDGIEYCDGWHDHKHMGISCICAYDYADDAYRVFCWDNIQEFQDLFLQAQVVVGFNSQHFDDSLCAANHLYLTTHYDVRLEVYRGLGLNPHPDYSDDGVRDLYRGRTLDALCQANGFGAKSGNGAQAPIDWQQGKYGTVIDYCLRDVRLTKYLFDAALSGQRLVDPVTSREFVLRKPFQDFEIRAGVAREFSGASFRHGAS